MQRLAVSKSVQVDDRIILATFNWWKPYVGPIFFLMAAGVFLLPFRPSDLTVTGMLFSNAALPIRILIIISGFFLAGFLSIYSFQALIHKIAVETVGDKIFWFGPLRKSLEIADISSIEYSSRSFSIFIMSNSGKKYMIWAFVLKSEIQANYIVKFIKSKITT